MGLIIRSKYIKPSNPPCVKDCKNRKPACQDKCQRYIEWKNEYNKKRNTIKNYNRNMSMVEDYEILRRLKNSRKKVGEG